MRLTGIWHISRGISDKALNQRFKAGLRLSCVAVLKRKNGFEILNVQASLMIKSLHVFCVPKKERAAAGNADSSEKREIYQNSVNRLKYNINH